MGKLVYTLADYQKAATTFRQQLLHIPILGLAEVLKYMTPVPGVRYEQLVGESSVQAQFAPYVAGRRTEANLNLVLRALRTYFGSVNADFEPNAEIQTLLGHRAAQALGDSQVGTPQAQEVLALVAKSLSHHLAQAIWNAKRNPTGTTSAELFDGFDTITSEEIAAGNLDESKKNYVKVDTTITKANAVDVLKEIMWNMDTILRKEDCFLFCPVYVADWYNEAYKMTSLSAQYNTQYNQNYLEGSNRKITIVPMPEKLGSKFIHITPKSNMLVGFDNMGDVENVQVKEFAPDILTYMAKMFFGTQFESIDGRRMMVAELADETDANPGKDNPGSGESSDTPGNNEAEGSDTGNNEGDDTTQP